MDLVQQVGDLRFVVEASIFDTRDFDIVYWRSDTIQFQSVASFNGTRREAQDFAFGYAVEHGDKIVEEIDRNHASVVSSHQELIG